MLLKLKGYRTILLPMIFLAVFITTQILSAAGEPRLVCEIPVYSFGTVDETEQVEHIFVLRNSGEAPLEISKVESTCGCTATKLGGTRIPPGGEVTLNAKINLRGRRGTQNKSIYVYSNDPQQPQLTLKITGSVVSEVDIIPRRLDFLDMGKTQKATKTALIENHSGLPLHITKAEGIGDFFTVSQSALQDGKRYQIAVTTVPPLSTGISRGAVLITTNKPNYSSISIPVSVRVQSDIIVAPRIISIPIQEGDRPPGAAFLAIRSRSKQPFRILSVKPPFPDISVKIIPLGADSYKLEIGNIVARNELNGKQVLIEMDNASSPQILVPIRIYSADPGQSRSQNGSRPPIGK